MSDAEKKLEKIEGVVSDFIQELGKSAVKDLDQIDPETKTLFMYKILKTLHNKDV